MIIFGTRISSPKKHLIFARCLIFFVFVIVALSNLHSENVRDKITGLTSYPVEYLGLSEKYKKTRNTSYQKWGISKIYRDNTSRSEISGFILGFLYSIVSLYFFRKHNSGVLIKISAPSAKAQDENRRDLRWKILAASVVVLFSVSSYYLVIFSGFVYIGIILTIILLVFLTIVIFFRELLVNFIDDVFALRLTASEDTLFRVYLGIALFCFVSLISLINMFLGNSLLSSLIECREFYDACSSFVLCVLSFLSFVLLFHFLLYLKISADVLRRKEYTKELIIAS